MNWKIHAERTIDGIKQTADFNWENSAKNTYELVAAQIYETLEKLDKHMQSTTHWYTPWKITNIQKSSATDSTVSNNGTKLKGNVYAKTTTKLTPCIVYETYTVGLTPVAMCATFLKLFITDLQGLIMDETQKKEITINTFVVTHYDLEMC